MKKNGKNFLLNLKTNNFEAGTWDPNYYLGFSKKKSLKNFAQILKLSECAKKTDKYYLNPIEYKNILSERHLIYNIEDSVRTKKRYFCVEEQTLLLGTVRAYLGNIIVTPMASWIGQKKGFVFPINSEFLAIKPKDKAWVTVALLPGGNIIFFKRNKLFIKLNDLDKP